MSREKLNLKSPDRYKNSIGFTDMLFNMLLGFVFLFIIILLYGFIIYRGILALQRSNDIFVVLAIGGLITMFGLQAFIHMGANIHILPTKGMTLPFVSYGGSSVIALGIAMGMLLGLSRKQN